jgi:hypothetical protein
LLAGCVVAKSSYDTVKTDYDNLKTEYTAMETEYAAYKAEMDALVKQFNDLVGSDEWEYLLTIVDIFPPKDFSSLSELEDFARENIQPETSSIEESFRAALRVQEAGINSGYTISVMYDEDQTAPGTGWIYCGALVNGTFYVWSPKIGTIYNDYEFLTR